MDRTRGHSVLLRPIHTSLRRDLCSEDPVRGLMKLLPGTSQLWGPGEGLVSAAEAIGGVVRNHLRYWTVRYWVVRYWTVRYCVREILGP